MDAINEFLAHLKNEGYSSNTIRTYKSALALLADRDISVVTTTDIMRILARYEDPATAASRLSALNTFFAWAVGQNLIQRNPAEGIESGPTKERLPTPIPGNDLKKITDFIATMPLPDQTYFALIRFLSLKPSEALYLRAEDVSWGERVITVKSQYNKRHIPFNAGDTELFALLRKLCRKREGLLFLSNHKRQASYYWAYRRWQRVMDHTGLNYTIEQLRQTRIIEWLNDGIDPKTVSRWVGGLNSMFDDYYMEG